MHNTTTINPYQPHTHNTPPETLHKHLERIATPYLSFEIEIIHRSHGTLRWSTRTERIPYQLQLIAQLQVETIGNALRLGLIDEF